jgi:uncharacterized protein
MLPARIDGRIQGKRMKRVAVLLLIAALPCLPRVHAAQSSEKPKIRAITGFIDISRTNYRQPVTDALAFLRQARASFEHAGYEVQSIRIATQPFSETTRGLSAEDALAFFTDYSRLVKAERFTASIGPAMFQSDADPREAELLAQVLAGNPLLNASLTVADEHGVRWTAVKAAARVMKHLEENTPGGYGNFNFAATALVPPYTPFYPGAYHNGPGKRFAIALQSANIVAEAFSSARTFTDGRTLLEKKLGTHARHIESVAEKMEKTSGWKYEGIDLSPAPLKDVSIGAAIERLTGQKFGAPGTMSAAAVTTAALQAIDTRHAGYSGLMVPVLEDAVLAERWSEGVLTLDALLSYSAVCGTGLDTVPLPGDVSLEQLERIIGDMASLAVRWKKPLTARLMPVPGKIAGARTEFDDPFLVNATLQRLP